MPDLPTNPVDAAALLRQWANDESLGGVKFSRGECARLADMIDRSAQAPDPAPKWDDPDPPSPADVKRPICDVCGVIPIDDGPCGFSQCPALIQ